MKKTAFACTLFLLAACVAGTPASGRGASKSLRLSDRVISVVGPGAVRIANLGRRPLSVSASDFALSAQGDMFRPRSARRVLVGPRHSHLLRLRFTLPRRAREHASLFYRASGSSIPLGRPARRAPSAFSSATTVSTFWATAGVGMPWGTAIDGAGNVWFAEPGCDFAPTCSASTRPGQIGVVKASSHAVVFYTLPNIPGNQPIFLAFDSAGKLWFTTPNNSMIGEFDPSTGQFVGQWPVTPGSGPWDLTIVGDTIWYAEHLVSAVGAFDKSTHAYRDFQTPSANSNPYGIAASRGLIWFTENNSGVDRIASLDTADGNAIAEYPIVQPRSGTPHLIAVDAGGHPWWSEGWSNTIATLDPAAATPGQCGSASGPCTGIQRFKAPPPSTCSTSGTHTSGIALQSAPDLVWFDNSLTAQVGSFSPSGGTFAMTTLGNCSAHPHDGLDLDAAGNVWFDEEFANAIGKLVAAAPPPPPPPSPPTITGIAPTSGPVGATVTITGTNLTGATGVRFNGAPSSYTVDSATQIRATVPAAASSGPISVTTPAGTATSNGNFSVLPGATGPLAADSFNRTLSGGWGAADVGGPWTILDAPANWSVTPGRGSVRVAAGAQGRAVLGGVAVQDVDLLTQVGLPLCTGGTNCDMYLVGRSGSGASASHYRVGAVQGQRSTVYLRAQRDDGSYLAADLNTGVPAAAGAVLWMRVEFQGANPTVIRARIWAAGTPEPSTWLLNTTDNTAAEQTAGTIGVRARNEDFSAAQTFTVLSFQASALTSG